MDKEKLQDYISEESKGCGCGDSHDACGCNDNHEGCGCGDDHEACGCGDDHEGCGCGCEENEALIVDLEDENGNIVPCEMVDGFSYKDNEYVLVQNPEDDSVYLFKVVGTEEDSELIIPEDEEFEEVSAYYANLSNDGESEEK
jgi:hypothetical protein